MNNLCERNPVPDGIQEPSEDPTGFIYSTYWAAKSTEHVKPSEEQTPYEELKPH
jgi:hypothetical protein